MARRGDRIGCKVMFKDKKLQDGKEKVPVLFFLNGKKIITEEKDPFLIDIDEPLYPYICMTDGVTVLTKMCPREAEDLESKLTKCLEKTNQKLGTSLEELVKYVDKKNEETNQKLDRNKEETNQKLEALLASLADIKKDLQYSETNT